MSKKQSGKAAGQEAVTVFRQFAWNLAGTLARRRPARRTTRKPAGS